MTRLLAPAPFVVSLVFAAAAPALGAETLDQVLANVRQATGAPALARIPGGVRLTGEAEFLGAPATVEGIFDAGGRSFLDIRGPVRMVTAFDGEQAWSIDLGGEMRPLHLGERARAILNTQIATHRCFDRGGLLAFTLNKAKTEEKSVVLSFTHDEGRITGTVAIDRATWLPTAWTMVTGDDSTTLKFDGILELAGLKLPATVRQPSSNGMETVFKFTKIEPAGPGADRAFAFSPAPPGDVRFDPAVPALLESNRARTQHILVHPLINGKDVGWFIFDTGAGINCLDEAAAAELGCRPLGQITATGAGGSVQSSVFRGDSISLGPVTLEQPLFIGIDLSMIGGALGEKIAGVIGYPILYRSAAEIDPEKGTVSLHDPAAWKDRNAAWTDLMLYNRHPTVPARFEGHDGDFVIDTGAANSALIFYAVATKRLGLLDGRETEPVMLGGVGGMSPARQGKIKDFELAGRKLENVTARFTTQNSGAPSDPWLTGNIGGQILTGRILLLDYQRNRIAIVDRE